ncbi:MAG: sodium:solute symporter family protein [Ignavibacteriaceae bacterium]
MNLLDWLIIIVYAGGLLFLGYYFSKNQKDTKDYFLAGRAFGWFPIALSTMATQLSVISFISAPAFVGLRENGGLKWLSFEFAVPLAMIFLMYVIIPPLYKSGVVSIYEYLEKRFGLSTRLIISVVFQLSRAFATGISVYAFAIVLSVVLNIPIWVTIIIAGVVTLIYSTLGGMKAVVYTDVIQMIILVLGIILIGWIGLTKLGGWGNFVAEVDHSRLFAVNFTNFGIGKGSEFGFLPMVIGGFFLYASYYGCDQTQVQRSLTGKNLSQVKTALLVNGLFRFPVTLSYCIVGLIIGTFVLSNAGFLSLMKGHNPDYMIPLFILNYIPNGLIGILVVAILSAGMGSLSSAMNSLSAVTVEDLIVRRRSIKLSNEKYVQYSRWFTVFWGVVCISVAFIAGNIAGTVIEAINKIGSLFYGPILATFLLAILSKKVNGTAVNIGLISGIIFNFLLWIFAGNFIFWFWWNFTGAAVTISIAYISAGIMKNKRALCEPAEREKVPLFSWETIILVGFFIFIVTFSYSIYLII